MRAGNVAHADRDLARIERAEHRGGLRAQIDGGCPGQGVARQQVELAAGTDQVVGEAVTVHIAGRGDHGQAGCVDHRHLPADPPIQDHGAAIAARPPEDQEGAAILRVADQQIHAAIAVHVAGAGDHRPEVRAGHADELGRAGGERLCAVGRHRPVAAATVDQGDAARSPVALGQADRQIGPAIPVHVAEPGGRDGEGRTGAIRRDRARLQPDGGLGQGIERRAAAAGERGGAGR